MLHQILLAKNFFTEWLIGGGLLMLVVSYLWHDPFSVIFAAILLAGAMTGDLIKQAQKKPQPERGVVITETVMGGIFGIWLFIPGFAMATGVDMVVPWTFREGIIAFCSMSAIMLVVSVTMRITFGLPLFSGAKRKEEST